MEISFEEQIKAITEEIRDQVEENIESGLNKVKKKGAADLRAKSPKKYGEYAKGWSGQSTGKRGIVIYNKTAPGLTHLLENGHVGKNQHGKWGRVAPVKHIEPVEKELIEVFEEELQKDL